MYIDIEKIIGRLQNTLEVKRSLGLDLVSMQFTDRELHEIIYLLGELNAIRKEQ